MLMQPGPYHSAGTGLAIELAWTQEHAATSFTMVALIIIHKHKTQSFLLTPPANANMLDY